MSHGPFGLDGATLGRVPAGCAIVNVAPASASANISTGVILVFMRILNSAVRGLFRHLEFSRFRGCNANESKLGQTRVSTWWSSHSAEAARAAERLALGLS